MVRSAGDDPGLASGVNSAKGQLVGLLAITVLPAAAGLTGGAAFGGAEFAAGSPAALRAAALIAAVALPVAVVTFRPARGGRAAPSAGRPRTRASESFGTTHQE